MSKIGLNDSCRMDILSCWLISICGEVSRGVFSASGAGTFLFTNNSYTLGTGATLTGSGTFQLAGAQLNVNAAGVTVDHLTLSSGTLSIGSGGSLSTSAAGLIDWNGSAVLTGAGSLTITSGATLNINGTGTRLIDGGTLNNNGTVNWSGGNNISVYDSGIISNLGGALFSV